ncbi:MAG: phosphatidate cytidylyltransferase [Dictyoglomi bacterium]|nr:phosphatidate cytidylyltransferase [Dictyoglomota bacterium]
MNRDMLRKWWSLIKETAFRSSIGVIYVAIVLGAVFLGGEYLYGLLSFMALVTVYEIVDMEFKGKEWWKKVIYGAVGVLLWLVLYFVSPEVFLALLFVIFFLWFFVYAVLLKKEEEVFSSSYYMFFFLIVYVLVGLYIGIDLYEHTGKMFFMSLLVMVWTFDVFSYAGGKTMGKTKLVPTISPGKTWEGFITGWLSLTILEVLLWLFHIWKVEPYTLGISVILLAPILLTGDLVESVVKRKAGVKDSGFIIPGHGGMWDRIDSTIAAFYIMWLLKYLEQVIGSVRM